MARLDKGTERVCTLDYGHGVVGSSFRSNENGKGDLLEHHAGSDSAERFKGRHSFFGLSAFCPFSAEAKVSVLKAVQLMLVALPIGFLGILLILPQIATDAMMYSNSIATRFTMQIWTGIVLLHFPFGVGFSGLLPAIRIYVMDAANALQSISPIPLNFEEVSSYAYSAQDAGGKTLLANYAAYFGFPFLFLAGRFCLRLVRDLYRQRQITLLACVCFLMIQLCTSVDSVAYYNLYLPFGIAVYWLKE